jgi:RNA polymerase primary sigma factor
MAVVTGVERAVRIHIDRGDNLNARDETGQTPLMLAAARDKAAICRLLLDAGADAGLRDPSGRDALDIARAAGAIDAVSVIEAACNPLPTDWNGAVELTRAAEPRKEASDADNGYANDQFLAAAAKSGASTHQGALIAVEDDSRFDLGGWEAEEDQAPPESDTILALTAAEVQTAITEHQPIDTSADWDDFEAILPDRAAPLPRAEDVEARERLRMVLLRAIREGSVPHAVVADVTSRGDGEPDAEAGALLVMVVNDLGAEPPRDSWRPVGVSQTDTADSAS